MFVKTAVRTKVERARRGNDRIVPAIAATGAFIRNIPRPNNRKSCQVHGEQLGSSVRWEAFRNVVDHSVVDSPVEGVCSVATDDRQTRRNCSAGLGVNNGDALHPGGYIQFAGQKV